VKSISIIKQIRVFNPHPRQISKRLKILFAIPEYWDRQTTVPTPQSPRLNWLIHLPHLCQKLNGAASPQTL
jgi:hypothetical protein